MGPETSNNNSGKSPYAFSNLKQTTILNILDVVIMVRMTCASLCKFYGKVNMIRYEAFVAMVEGTRGATAAKRKCCHGNIPEIRQLKWDASAKEQVWVREMCKSDGEWSRIPGVPHVGGKAKEGQRAPTIRTRGEQGCISSNMHSFVHGRRVRVIPS